MDGSDHTYRERVAQQFKISVIQKRRFRICAVPMLLTIIIAICHIINMKTKFQLTKQALPPVEIWEFMYASSLFSLFLGWIALPKNRVGVLSVFMLLNGILSIGPLLFAAGKHSLALKELIVNKKSAATVFGKPFVLVLYIYLLIALGSNCAAMFSASKLVQAWKTKGDKQS